jgi:hypothetical protein
MERFVEEVGDWNDEWGTPPGFYDILKMEGQEEAMKYIEKYASYWAGCPAENLYPETIAALW